VFCQDNCNYTKAVIFNNSLFRDPESGSVVSKNFFGLDFYNRYADQIRNLKYEDCFSILGYKTLIEFREMGLPVGMATWMRLRNILLHIRPAVRPISNVSISIHEFVDKWKKGGKKIRSILCRIGEKHYHVNQSRNFLTLTTLIGTIPDPMNDLGIWTSAWNIHSLPNAFRNFIFNSRNNSLPLNNRLNSYLPEINPNCTYCRVMGNNPAPRDSFQHCFLLCPYASLLLNHLKNSLGLGNVHTESEEFNLAFWYGIPVNKSSSSIEILAWVLVFDSFRYIFFTNRQKKQVLSVREFMAEYYFFVKNICCFNKNLKLANSIAFRNTSFLQAIG
jgi:hypothetical protein